MVTQVLQDLEDYQEGQVHEVRMDNLVAWVHLDPLVLLVLKDKEEILVLLELLVMQVYRLKLVAGDNVVNKELLVVLVLRGPKDNLDLWVLMET